MKLRLRIRLAVMALAACGAAPALYADSLMNTEGVSTTGTVNASAFTINGASTLTFFNAALIGNTSGGSGGSTASDDALISGTLKTTATLQAGNTDTSCSGTADYGKIRFDSTTKKSFLCRP